MAVTYTESYDERKVSMDRGGFYRSIEFIYIVSGASDEFSAVSAVRSGIAQSVNSVPLDSVELASKINASVFKVRAIYAESTEMDDSQEEEEAVLSYDCGAGTKHLTRSIAQTRIYGSTDAGGLIGWNGKSGAEKEVAGVDVPAPQLRATFTKRMRLTALTTTYMRNIAALVGTVNSATWKGWLPGEVMFLGWSYSAPMRGAKKVLVTFSFGIQLNETVTISGGTTYNKKGYDYIWTLTKSEVQGNGIAVVPDSIYVDQVAKYADFSVLGL